MKLIATSILSLVVAVSALSADFSVTPENLTAEINIRKTKVWEFQQLHDYGEAHNLRIWIAGGSAAGLAHYVKDDFENESLKAQGKEPIYFEGRFGYNYFDIYRSTQDCDVVINGDERQAVELENFIRQNFSHLQGSKEIFEVRLLDQARGSGSGEKDALLNNPDFLNQHTDSHSTGMIELTQPPVNKSVVRDLFDWENQKNSKFLLDVVDNQLSYYFSDKHNTTKRFKQGINPPIISVLRYYTKLFQYGLKPRPEDEQYLVQIIQEFNPTDAEWSKSYVNKQINKNGIKMIRHAQDMEFAMDTISRVGLRSKLMGFQGTQNEKVSWWVNKAPLRSFPLGSLPGKTAKELNLTVVAHETKDFLAYESITISRRGVPNVFISREDCPDENALHGDGFYTQVGIEGARGTGFTIRYTLNPDAVEGADFFIVRDSPAYVVFLNKNALKVIDESVELGPVEFFNLLLTQDISHADIGVWKKIELKVMTKIEALSENEFRSIAEVLMNNVDQLVDYSKKIDVLLRWVYLGHSQQYPQIIEKVVDLTKDRNVLDFIAVNILSREEWSKIPQGTSILEKILSDGIGNRVTLLDSVFSKPYWMQLPITIKAIEQMLQVGIEDGNILKSVLSDEYWEDKEEGIELLKKVLLKENNNSAFISYILSKPYWWKHQFVVDKFNAILETKGYESGLAKDVFSLPFTWEFPQIETYLTKIIKRSSTWIVNSVFSQEYWIGSQFAENSIRYLLKHKKNDLEALIWMLKGEKWANRPIAKEIISTALAYEKHGAEIDQVGVYDKNIAQLMSSKSFPIVDYLSELETIIDRGRSEDVMKVFFREELVASTKGQELFKKAIAKSTNYGFGELQQVLKEAHWSSSPIASDLLKKVYEIRGFWALLVLNDDSWSDVDFTYQMLEEFGDGIKTRDSTIVRQLLSDVLPGERWAKDERTGALLQKIIQTGSYNGDVVKVLKSPAWAENPMAVKLLSELVKHVEVDLKIIEDIMINDYWYKKDGVVELLEEIILRSSSNEGRVINYALLEQNFYANHPRFRALVGGKDVNFINIKQALQKEVYKAQDDCSRGLQAGGM